MGKIQNILPEQEIILDEIKQNDFLKSHFYFTGGTALSSVYLNHRYSDDLDFFSFKKIDNQLIFTFMEECSKKHNFTFQSRFAEVVYIFNLSFKNKKSLKVDFGYYPYKKLEEGINVEGMEVDSLLDIAVNKLLTISQRTDVKDFVDLYFLLRDFTIWDLMAGLKVKFNIKTEPFLIATDFLKVEDFEFMPKMIVSLDLKELKLFFRQKAKGLGAKAVE